MASENFAERKCSYVTDRSCKNNVTKKTVGIGGVGQKSEVPEHPADVNKPDDGQRHALQFAARAVAQNRNEENQRDRKHRNGNKKSIPAGARLFATRMRNQ